MRLVRGSIFSSKPCSTSQAARIVRRFLCSDEGTDVSVKSFLTRVARSLESMAEGGHSSEKKKQRLDPQTSQDLENPATPRNPNEGFSGLEHRDGARGSKILDSEKHRKKREKSYREGLTTEKDEVDAKRGEEATTEESRKFAKRLREKHVLEGGESELDSGLCITPLVEKSEKSWRVNGTTSTSMEIEEVETEKRREKGRKHACKENHDHDDFGEKLDLEVMETPATHKKKSRRARSNDEGTVDEDGDLVFSSHKRSEQGKHHVNEVKELDQKHHFKTRVLEAEAEAEAIADGQTFHSIKKKRKDKTSK